MVAVKITGWPRVTGFGEPATEVVVDVAMTTCPPLRVPVLLTKPTMPFRLAVTVWLPAVSAAVEPETAIPPRNAIGDPNVVPSIRNCTAPRAVDGVTVAVKAIAWEYGEGFRELETDVVVGVRAPSSMVTLLLPAFATAMSSMPSRLKSATVIAIGLVPATNGLALAAANPPEPFPSNSVTLLPSGLATARSRMPSPLKSPVARACGPAPVANGLPLAGVNPPELTPRSMVTVPSVVLAIARSRLPSPLKSPVMIACGPLPTANGLTAAVKPPAPLPSSSVTLLLAVLAIARSRMPSRLKSPTAIPDGLLPTAKGLPLAAAKLPEPVPSNTVTVEAPKLAIARSSLPSPLKSPVSMARGPFPTARGLPAAALNFPAPMPSSTVTVLSPLLATARSNLPSPSKSPTAMA